MADSHHHREILCRDFVELVTEYLEGALPAERVELVEQHLVMCDWCKTYLEQLEATVRALPDAVEPERVPAETELALLAAFRDWRDRP